MTADPRTPHPDAEALAIVERVLDLGPAERAAALDELCAGRTSMRARVEKLLEWDAREHGLLDGGASALEELLLAPPNTAPDAVDGYRIIRELGRGGMGVVWLAERTGVDFRQEVALKVIAGHADPESLAGRLRRERQILAGLRHPNIAQLLDGGVTASGLPYLVMEYIEGERIDRWCDARRLDTHARVRLFLAVCSAVEHVQDRFVVHRDLKPTNLLVTADGIVKLLDFGIAKSGAPAGPAPGAPETRTQLLAFSPGYASPEQLRNLEATPATDVYALGVILYELLAGVPPHPRGDDPYEAARAVLETDPLPPSQAVAAETESSAESAAARSTSPQRLGRTLRGDLDAIVLHAMSRRPEDRYADARALREDLERFLALQPVHARRLTRRYRMRKFGRRHRAVVAVGVAAVTLGGVASAVTMRGGRPEASRAAYDHLVRGDLRLAARTPGEVRRAIEQYRAAAAAAPRSAEPRFREAYAWLVYADWGWAHPTLTPEAMLERAADHLDRGLAIAPGAPEGLAALGYLRVLRDPDRLGGALDAFEQALAGDRDNVETWHQYGQALMVLDRFDDAARAYGEALRLEPRRAMTLVPLSAMALFSDRLDEARAWADSAVAVEPANSYARASRARVLLAAGDTAGARAEAELAAGVDHGHAIPVTATLVMALAAAGDSAGALAAYADLPRAGKATSLSPTDASFLAMGVLALGDTTRALELIDRAKPRGAWLRFYLRSPSFDAVRDNSAFRRIVLTEREE